MISFSRSIVILLIFSFSTSAWASPLEDVLHSKDIKRIERETKQLETQAAKQSQDGSSQWLNPRTNIGKLFLNKGYRSKLIPWLITKAAGVKIGKVGYTKEKEFLTASTKIVFPSKEYFYFRVLVPHPRYREMIDLGLVNEFKRLKPRKAFLQHHKKMNFKQFEADLYQTTDNTCILLIYMHGGTVLELKTKNCINPYLLSDFAVKLDLNRTNRKLQT